MPCMEKQNRAEVPDFKAGPKATFIRKIQTLDEFNANMRNLNQRFLAFNIDAEKIAGFENWEDLTRLKGQRTRRLRETPLSGVGI